MLALNLEILRTSPFNPAEVTAQNVATCLVSSRSLPSSSPQDVSALELGMLVSVDHKPPDAGSADDLDVLVADFDSEAVDEFIQHLGLDFSTNAAATILPSFVVCNDLCLKLFDRVHHVNLLESVYQLRDIIDRSCPHCNLF